MLAATYGLSMSAEDAGSLMLRSSETCDAMLIAVMCDGMFKAFWSELPAIAMLKISAGEDMVFSREVSRMWAVALAQLIESGQPMPA